jgi:hypothetical protein
MLSPLPSVFITFNWWGASFSNLQLLYGEEDEAVDRKTIFVPFKVHIGEISCIRLSDVKFVVTPVLTSTIYDSVEVLSTAE